MDKEFIKNYLIELTTFDTEQLTTIQDNIIDEYILGDTIAKLNEKELQESANIFQTYIADQIQRLSTSFTIRQLAEKTINIDGKMYEYDFRLNSFVELTRKPHRCQDAFKTCCIMCCICLYPLAITLYDSDPGEDMIRTPVTNLYLVHKLKTSRDKEYNKCIKDLVISDINYMVKISILAKLNTKNKGVYQAPQNQVGGRLIIEMPQMILQE